MAKPNSKKKTIPSHRVHLFYAGRVQGVGFRYTAEEIALNLHLTGWVKNLHDGRVEVVAEGSKDTLELFLERVLSSHLAPHIKKCESVWEKSSGEFSDFRVEFCY